MRPARHRTATGFALLVNMGESTLRQIFAPTPISLRSTRFPVFNFPLELICRSSEVVVQDFPRQANPLGNIASRSDCKKESANDSRASPRVQHR